MLKFRAEKGDESMEKMVLNRPEIFSAKERIIAKLGLCAAIPAAALYDLYQTFPENPLLASAFASVGVIALIAAFLCLLAQPTEIAAGKVKKLAAWGRMYSGRASADFRTPKQLLSYAFGAQRHTCHRNNARARRSVSRPAFVNGPKGSSDDGDSDQGDPPGP